MLQRLLAAAVAAVTLLAAAPAAEARPQTTKKGIWGPVRVDGASQFPIYEELGAGVYNATLSWASVARQRPAKPRDPADPAYVWPADLDDAAREAKRHGMRMAVLVIWTPPWANGGKTQNWAPDRPRDYGDFMAAAARRYPSVRYWIAWGEPSRSPNFMPSPGTTPPGKPLKPAQKKGPRIYARMLDAAYGAIKKVDRRALVVGGNTFTSGQIGPRNWIRNMKLPSGRPPRMDLYGHNPFAARRPDLAKRPLVDGYADFCDLDDLARWVDRDLGRTPRGRPIKLWLGEYTTPTGHFSGFNYRVSRRTQASWLSSALRITRRWSRIETLNWLTLYDDPARADGNYTTFGLIGARGRRKPSFNAFARG